jgi:hypothetical protein
LRREHVKPAPFPPAVKAFRVVADPFDVIH